MERNVNFDNSHDVQLLFGKYDQNLKLIEKELDIKIFQQNNGLKIVGQKVQVDKAVDLFDYLLRLAEQGSAIKPRDIYYADRKSTRLNSSH